MVCEHQELNDLSAWRCGGPCPPAIPLVQILSLLIWTSSFIVFFSLLFSFEGNFLYFSFLFLKFFIGIYLIDIVLKWIGYTYTRIDSFLDSFPI